MDATQEMKTLSECVDDAIKEGFKENFRISGRGLATADKRAVFRPAEVTIYNFYRFEGYSDPQDNAILYLITTKNGKKGTLIDAYGSYADAKLAKFITQVEEIQKKVSGESTKG